MLLWATVLAAEGALVVVYLELTGTEIDRIRYVVYPFVWINLGLWAVLRARPVGGSLRIRSMAGLAAAGYFLLLLALPGKIAVTVASGAVSGLQVSWAVPGWGPIITYGGSHLQVYVVPFEVIGYLALAYLVYANVVNLARSSLAGLVGVVTCVGCTVPVLVPVLGILGGTGTTLASTAYSWSYDVGTVLFAVVVVLLLRGVRPKRE